MSSLEHSTHFLEECAALFDNVQTLTHLLHQSLLHTQALTSENLQLRSRIQHGTQPWVELDDGEAVIPRWYFGEHAKWMDRVRELETQNMELAILLGNYTVPPREQEEAMAEEAAQLMLLDVE